VPIVCVLTATCSPSRLLVAAPFLTGRLLSSSTVIYSACSLIAFFTNSGARSRKECASHIECMSSTSLVDVRGRRASLPADGRRASGRRTSTRQQMVDVRLCLLAISLTTCRLNYICKEVLHYFPDLFYNFLGVGLRVKKSSHTLVAHSKRKVSIIKFAIYACIHTVCSGIIPIP